MGVVIQILIALQPFAEIMMWFFLGAIIFNWFKALWLFHKEDWDSWEVITRFRGRLFWWFVASALVACSWDALAGLVRLGALGSGVSI
jgi:hypothetical protein